MKLFRLSAQAMAVCAVLLAASVASAHSPYQFLLGGNNYGFGYGGYNVNQPVLPYFSQYPPVYYSHPVPRPYGFSPYAALPGMIPAELRVQQQPAPAPTPQMIPNPFMDEAEPVFPEDGNTAKRGAAGLQLSEHQQLIENPYVQDRATPVSAPALAIEN